VLGFWRGHLCQNSTNKMEGRKIPQPISTWQWHSVELYQNSSKMLDYRYSIFYIFIFSK
jgi:hypothetical protein